MTIGMAWVATRADKREDLYFASDSRTRGGWVLNMCPKIMLLPRSDSALCFAGDTAAAYPLMLQIANAIGAHEPARRRNLDLAELKSHLLRVLTDFARSITDASVDFGSRDADFILAGYSWRSKTFRIWSIYFESKSRAYRAREAANFHERLKKVMFIGDWARRFRHSLIDYLKDQGSDRLVEFEPLQLLAKTLRETGPDDSIGGPPQVVRIGPHMNTRPLCVLWGQQGKPTLFGRQLFEYENCDFWTIDPDTGAFGPPPSFHSKRDNKAV